MAKISEEENESETEEANLTAPTGMTFSSLFDLDLFDFDIDESPAIRVNEGHSSRRTKDVV